MVVRLLLAALTLLGIAALAATGDPAFGAPAATNLGDLAFSQSVDREARPQGRGVLFPPGTSEVWASFEYRDHEPGKRLTFLVTVDGQDFQFGDLTCCAGSGGRYAFPIRRLLTRSNVAGYEVRVFEDGVELTSGFFAVGGIPNDNDVGGDNDGGGGSDNDDQDGNDNNEDNGNRGGGNGND